MTHGYLYPHGFPGFPTLYGFVLVIQFGVPLLREPKPSLGEVGAILYMDWGPSSLKNQSQDCVTKARGKVCTSTY